jgi:hypothetical protein
MTTESITSYMKKLYYWTPKDSEMRFLVNVSEIRSNYGTVEVLAHPLQGMGSQWVKPSDLIEYDERTIL